MPLGACTSTTSCHQNYSRSHHYSHIYTVNYSDPTREFGNLGIWQYGRQRKRIETTDQPRTIADTTSTFNFNSKLWKLAQNILNRRSKSEYISLQYDLIFVLNYLTQMTWCVTYIGFYDLLYEFSWVEVKLQHFVDTQFCKIFVRTKKNWALVPLLQLVLPCSWDIWLDI